MRRIPIEMIMVLVMLGVTIGIAWSRWTAIETQIANHSARITVLEADHKKRMQLKACVEVVASIAVKCLQKVSFGLIKLH